MSFSASRRRRVVFSRRAQSKSSKDSGSNVDGSKISDSSVVDSDEFLARTLLPQASHDSRIGTIGRRQLDQPGANASSPPSPPLRSNASTSTPSDRSPNSSSASRPRADSTEQAGPGFEGRGSTKTRQVVTARSILTAKTGTVCISSSQSVLNPNPDASASKTTPIPASIPLPPPPPHQPSIDNIKLVPSSANAISWPAATRRDTNIVNRVRIPPQRLSAILPPLPGPSVPTDPAGRKPRRKKPNINTNLDRAQRDKLKRLYTPLPLRPSPSSSGYPIITHGLLPSPSAPMSQLTTSPPPHNTDPPRHFQVPALYSTWPPLSLSSPLPTPSSDLQEDTVEEVLPFLTGGSTEEEELSYLPRNRNAAGIPPLLRSKHIAFCRRQLEETKPGGYVGFDASRPWLLYWNLVALRVLGQDVGEWEERVIQNLTAAQNPEGGIGGGHGQFSHIAPTYAGVLSLAMLGDGALECIDRRALWHWLGQLKQSDGGFAVSLGAEVDVRGAYCSLTVIALLGLPLELPPSAPAREAGLTSFADKLPEWLARCQTYEGGISGMPGTEAHGAYAFCVLACACILGDPRETIPNSLTEAIRIFDLPRLIGWLSARQNAPEGGFSGRTNKLVDGCYSHWVGGCWPLIESALQPKTKDSLESDGMYSREGLIRYILCCCQQNTGGLRDKPSTRPDGYHSCYVLAGLSQAQYHVNFTSQADMSEPLEQPFHWRLKDGNPLWKGLSDLVDKESIVNPIHPVFVIPFESVDRTRAWRMHKGGF